MRILMRVTIPNQKAAEYITRGKLGEIMQSILADMKPEAVYLTADGGKRTAYLVVHISDNSEMPKLAEPWFLAMGADVEFLPAMVPADLQKAAADLAAIGEKYGK